MADLSCECVEGEALRHIVHVRVAQGPRADQLLDHSDARGTAQHDELTGPAATDVHQEDLPHRGTINISQLMTRFKDQTPHVINIGESPEDVP